jgi:hypothetical protein
MPDEMVSLCECLSWIAFRRKDHSFEDPAELRRAMDEHPELVRCKRPARELLKALSDGKLPSFGLYLGQGGAGGRQEMVGFDWSTITEDQIWGQAEADWQRKRAPPISPAC